MSKWGSETERSAKKRLGDIPIEPIEPNHKTEDYLEKYIPAMPQVISSHESSPI